ncbi:MAG: ATP-dependent DNA helicase [Candidatus Nitrotoga sp.]
MLRAVGRSRGYYRMTYTVAVRTLCEFAAKSGDLDLRFTPSSSAQEGIIGHAVVRSRRNSIYKAEISVNGEYKQLLVRGRADGYDPALNQLEEIKTYRGDLNTMPVNHRQLHWAQAKIYGWLLCQQLDLSEMNVALVYYDIDEQTETVLTDIYSVDELKQFFEELCSQFLAWAEQETRHHAAHNQGLCSIQFPHVVFRTGQRELAEAVYKSAKAGCCLLAQAPTGIGKTVGTLFPLLKASPTEKLDKIFYLTAKTSGRQLALNALELIKCSTTGLSLRVLELVARDKACEHLDKLCHGDSCPLAKGFYDRLPGARNAILDSNIFDKATVRKIALDQQICPYYLSQELVQWSDVVVGDYNYYFDVKAMLHAMTVTNQWRVSVLIDEAHNMIDRARKMYSAELDQKSLKSLQASSPMELKKTSARLNRSWNSMHKNQNLNYQVYALIPDKFLKILQQLTDAITDYLGVNPANMYPLLQRFYFDAIHFLRIAEAFNEHSIFDITKSIDESRRSILCGKLCIRNIIPAHFLKQRFAALHSSVLFSATLNPWKFYVDMLGLPQNTPRVNVLSPFRSEQLSVQVVRWISTRYLDRENSLSPIVDLMARQFEERPGNYLAFFSSFDYLQNIQLLFKERYPKISTWNQCRHMDEAEKNEFMKRFTVTEKGIAFAILGSSFSEGVDLPGEHLIGTFIATLGLPQLNPVNEQIKVRMESAFGTGFEYAYLYPGIQKVVQAAGRVIRTTSDRGVVLLVDDRFSRKDVLQLLPSWWKIEVQSCNI